jgi:predicted nucleic acid-binding protein
MSGKVFLDSNIIIYAYDPDDLQKQARAIDLIQEVAADGRGVVSYQVVQEFLNFSLGKAQVKLTHRDAQQVLAELLLPMLTVHSSATLFSAAIRLHERHRLSWYDSLIVSAAQQAGCEILYSEDLQHGQQFGALTIQDPFR